MSLYLYVYAPIFVFIFTLDVSCDLNKKSYSTHKFSDITNSNNHASKNSKSCHTIYFVLLFYTLKFLSCPDCFFICCGRSSRLLFCVVWLLHMFMCTTSC